MTSDARVSKIYVWTQIQGEPVLAGAFEPGNRVGAFYYADSYVQRPDVYALDPVNLPLIGRRDFHTQANGGIFGVLLDAGPDSWGQRVLLKLSPSAPRTPLEFLLAGNGEGVGSLLFSLSRASPKRPALMGSSVELSVLERAAHKIQSDQDLPESIRDAVLAGSFMGGARPKAAVEIDGGPWMAKFSRVTDLYDEIAAEEACLEMSRQLGFEVPQSRVVVLDNGRKVLLTRRFDFDERGHKRHYISAHSLLDLYRANEQNPEHGYPGLADRLRMLPSGKELARELYRRLIFRFLVGDTDDHGKNHGFMLVNGTYAHAPVFDVLPHLNTMQEQAMPIGRLGRARSFANLLSMPERFGYSKEDAIALIERQQTITRQWSVFFEKAGAGKQDIATLAPCFAMSGSDPRPQRNRLDAVPGHEP